MNTIKKIHIKAERIQIAAEDRAVYETTIRTPDDVGQIASHVLAGEDQEVVLAFYLNIKNKVLGFSEVARGGLDICHVDPRVVFRAAVLQGAAAIILVHNHPSGDPQPSGEDFELTKRLIKAGEILGIELLDHVVVADSESQSIREYSPSIWS